MFPAWSVQCPDSPMLLPSGPAYVVGGSHVVIESIRSVPVHVNCNGVLYHPLLFAAMAAVPVTVGGCPSVVIDMIKVVTSPAESVAFICM